MKPLMKQLVSNSNCIHAPRVGVTRMKTFLRPLFNACFDVCIHAPNFCDDQHLVDSRAAPAAVGLGGGRAPVAELVALGARRSTAGGYAGYRSPQTAIPRAGFACAAACRVDGFVAGADGVAPASAGVEGVAASWHFVRNTSNGRLECEGDMVVFRRQVQRCTSSGQCLGRHRCDVPLGDGIARACHRPIRAVGAFAGREAPFFTHAGLRARHGQSFGLRRHCAGRMVRCMAELVPLRHSTGVPLHTKLAKTVILDA
jgi:hypothetical protein